MIDIGVNLLNEQFAGDRESVIARAWAAGLTHLVVTGTDLDVSRAAVELVSGAAPGRMSATAGIHPHHAAETPGGWQRTLIELAGHPRVVAIGETGLDFHRNYSPRAEQERVFLEQLDLAARLEMPVFVHDRDAGERVAGCLTEAADLAAGVVVHCFTGTREDLRRYLDLGCHIGITGWVCDRRRGEALRSLVPDVPLGRLLVETDAPFLRPHNAPPGGGRRNEPALLVWVIRRLAELYGVAETALADVTAANARRLFRLPDDVTGS